MLTIGIDPGAEGAVVALQWSCGKPVAAWSLLLRHYRREGGCWDAAALTNNIAALVAFQLTTAPLTAIAIETPPPVMGGAAGRAGLLSQGRAWGVVEACALIALDEHLTHGTALHRPLPKEWQQVGYRGIAGKRGDKTRSLHAAALHIPCLDLAPKPLRTPHDGIADAGLLALWAGVRGAA